MLCISAVYAVMRCLSVCPSVYLPGLSRSWIMSKRITIPIINVLKNFIVTFILHLRLLKTLLELHACFLSVCAVTASAGRVNKGRGRLQRSGTQCVWQEHWRSLVETRTRTASLYRYVTVVSTWQLCSSCPSIYNDYFSLFQWHTSLNAL